MLTAFLSRADVSRHLQALHLLQEFRDAFTQRREAPSKVELEFQPTGATTRVRQASLEGLPAWAVTVQSRTADGVRSTVQLHESPSGKLLATMDGTHLTALRTAITGALGVDVLARADAKHVAVLGSGTAASGALKALRLVRSLEQIWFHEPNLADNFELAHRLGKTMAMATHAVDTVAEAVAQADIVLLTGGVGLGDARLKRGAHVSVLDAERFETSPLPKDVLGNAVRVVDATTPTLGWLPDAVELGAVLAGERPGRQSADQLTCFASVGPAALDLLTAWHVFEGARHDEALTRIDLEA